MSFSYLFWPWRLWAVLLTWRLLGFYIVPTNPSLFLKPVLKVLAHADLILLLLLFQHTVHRFGGSPTCSDCLSQCMLIISWIAIPLFSRKYSSTQTAFSSVLFLDGCPKHLASLTEVTPVFNLDTHLETFLLSIYLLSKFYFQRLKVRMLFPIYFKCTVF